MEIKFNFQLGTNRDLHLITNVISRQLIRMLLILGFLSTLFGCEKEAPTDQPQFPAVAITNDVQHNEVYERGIQLISLHMQLSDRNPRVTKAVRDEVSRGIRDLDAVTAYNPENWSAFWTKGKGYQVLGDHRAAYAEFKESFNIQKENPDVAREYAGMCLELGHGAEAVRATQHAINLTPDDAGLHANLALAYLINGRNADAKQAIERALKMVPDDKTSQAVQRVIIDVISGKRKQPKTMADLY